jgi:lipopolysaccharide/colanic/teichoic acid biosynthesis glycosyltransferase
MSRPMCLVKRVVDLTAAGIALVVLAPLLATVALAVRLVNGSPVTFRQERSGRGGRPFTLVKFRTMRPATADERGPDHDASRLTRLGRWLRSTSLDELPTLVHVVRGEMSLVGPRPLPVEYLRRYDDTQARRLEVRPGITGWAQIHGRNEVPWDERLALDVWYVDHATLRLDLRILAATVRQVVRREGIDASAGTTMTEFHGSDR